MIPLRDLWERLTLYLPVLVMGLMAMATYWLVRNTPTAEPARPASAPTHHPDYFMKQFEVKTFDNTGRLKSEVKGLSAKHYPDTDTLEIDNVEIHSYDTKGRITTATARQAITNGDGSEVQLIGNAKVVRDAGVDDLGNPTPSMIYMGEFLHAFMNTEQVKSHKPVELIRGKDRFTADSLDFDNLERVVVLNGRVRGLLTPNNAPRK